MVRGGRMQWTVTVEFSYFNNDEEVVYMDYKVDANSVLAAMAEVEFGLAEEMLQPPQGINLEDGCCIAIVAVVLDY